MRGQPIPFPISYFRTSILLIIVPPSLLIITGVMFPFSKSLDSRLPKYGIRI